MRDACRQLTQRRQPIGDDHVLLKLVSKDLVIDDLFAAPAMVGLLDLFDEPGKLDRFGEVVEETETHAFQSGLEICVTGEHHDLHPWMPFLDSAERFDAVHPRHANVEDHHVDRVLIEDRESVGAIGGGEGRQATELEALSETHQEVHLVVDEENMRSRCVRHLRTDP